MGSSSGIVVRRARADWERLVRRWQRSGQTAREFGDAHGVRAGALAWWKWRLGTAQFSGARQSPPRLVAVDVIEDRADRGDVDASEWELVNASGVRLRVRGPLTGADLRVVIAALTTSAPRPRRR
jgi:hypothetical protein